MGCRLAGGALGPPIWKRPPSGQMPKQVPLSVLLDTRVSWPSSSRKLTLGLLEVPEAPAAAW